MEQEIGYRQQQPVVVILITLVAVFIGMQVMGPLIGMVIAVPFYPGGLIEMTEALQQVKDPAIKVPLYIVQGCATFTGLILVPFIMMRLFHRPLSPLFKQAVYAPAVLMVIMVVIFFMGVNSVFIEWNEALDLPQRLKNLEEQLKTLTTFLTHFDSVSQLVIAVIVIAVLPAIGEELVFRGIIQNEFYRSTRNIHVSIWVSAAIFSAIHMQFLGFMPRMLLGALFGYLYYWSGSLPLAMLAHFINNGMMVVAMYFYQQGKLEVDLESPEAASWPTVVASVVLTGVILYAFKKFHDNKNVDRNAPPDAYPHFNNT